MKLRARIGNGNEWQTDDPSSTAANPKYIPQDVADEYVAAGIAEVIPEEPPPPPRPAKKQNYKRRDMTAET